MNIDNDFSIFSFLNNNVGEDNNESLLFENTSKFVLNELQKEWDMSDHKAMESQLLREKNAIIGKVEEVEYYKNKIRKILRDNKLTMTTFPNYHTDLIDAIFHENWGLSGLAPWVYDATDTYKFSSSAKLIGNRMYCLINGEEVLQEQTLNEKRRLQLKKALLLGKPDERLENGFHEVYLNNGIRVTIYSGDRTKKGEDIMVFRKYILKELTFEKMAEFNTIPFELIPVFKSMIKIGYNTLFSGQVRSGKTTFMICWQKYEDPKLEGLAIATDPETPWHKIMPNAPIMQIVADDEELNKITKSLLRGDNDYVLLEEMRDATAFNIALDITSTGTLRSKGTIHTNKASDIPYKMGSKIVSKYGGDLNACIAQVFQNFNYVLEFVQLSTNKSSKRLKGICEFRYDEVKDLCSIHRICEYDYKTDSWKYKYDMGEDKKLLGIAYSTELQLIKETLLKLEKQSPILENNVLYPAYYKSIWRDENG
ncbi:MAG: ATPase, T2SS/T4P/T4SS family [Anaerovoracaceae bacterium]